MALLLFVSGACSLVYETVWLRDLRLVFGASTMASAAVLACFIGGVGGGGLLFGKRADASGEPLRLYAKLEGGIAVCSALTPILLVVVRAAYLGAGGTRALGAAGAGAIRALLAAMVVAVPATLMGGTLPAAARAVEGSADRGRRALAMLYAANSLGAVAGCMLSTFVLLERYGSRDTLWTACLVNALVALAAWRLSRGMHKRPATPTRPARNREARAPGAWFPLAAAAMVGFVFYLMEIVWYRMLSSLLGGSVFSFGLILATALFGIGLGSALYALRPSTRGATLRAFVLTCTLEAALLAIPYALGDRLALLAILLRPLGAGAFALQVIGWAVVTGIIVLPASTVSGFQFPLLMGLLGRGDTNVGRDVGLAYACNTLGSIAGSLSAAFGLLPMLGALGCWRLAVWLLLALGVIAVALDGLHRELTSVAALLATAAAIACFQAQGPTAAWRHSPIGAGRVALGSVGTPNAVRAWEYLRRRSIAWAADGLESSVAIDYETGLTFLVNGKADGAARTDAGTPVMLGLLGAMLVEHPTTAMVIGLGTGETAGWLAGVESISKVDVAELEKTVLEVARRCAVINHDALQNPKVQVEIGDARDLLFTSRERYSIIASEPSNPYRGGVASLFTREYYGAVSSHLEDDGVFVQWLQGYEVNADAVRTVYTTLASVFPEVETWELSSRDLAFVAARRPIVHDLARMRARMGEEPYRSAIGRSWRVTDIEGFLAHFVANADLARAVEGRVNTDDENIVEFALARTVGSSDTDFRIEDIRRAALQRNEHRPKTLDAPVDWDRVDDAVVELALANEGKPTYPEERSPDRAHRMAAMRAFEQGNSRRVVEEWRAQPREPAGPTQTALLATALADLGDERALHYAEALRTYDPGELDAITAHLRMRQGRYGEATTAFEGIFARLRGSPWPMVRLALLALSDARALVARDAGFAPRIYAALREPFALREYDELRKQAALGAALRCPGSACVEALQAFEPNVSWEEDFLTARLDCYRAAGDARESRAERDLEEWRAARPAPFEEGLRAR